MPLGEVTDAYAVEHLGVRQSTATASDNTGVLPPYIRRNHDEVLEGAVQEAQASSVMRVLVGGSGCGKTRALLMSLRSLRSEPEWRLWHPRSAEQLRDTLARDQVAPHTVIWLNESDRYLLAEPGEQAGEELRRLLAEGPRPVLVLGTLRTDHHHQLTARPAPAAPDPHAQARELLAGRCITVPDEFSDADLRRAAEPATDDGRLAEALRHGGRRITQYLAGGPTEALNEPVPEPPSDSAPWLREAAEGLAVKVYQQWNAEWERRRLHLSSSSLAVRFHNAAAGRFDHWAEIRKAPPGMDPPPLQLADQLEKIVDVYKSVPSGRLVVLGEAGAGKTVLALRFVLGLLHPPNPDRGDHVPVIFSFGSWDPTTTSLREWMCNQLVRDYPDLAAPTADGRSLARALVDADRILPVLDGFDEIARHLRDEALQVLNDTSMPLLLTSRPKEYGKARTVLSAAAGIQLDGLAPRDFADYLRRTSQPAAGGGLHSTVWEPVLAQLGERPRSPGAKNVALALTTPLMVTLARTVYSDAPGVHSDTPGPDPQDLLDTTRFPTPEDVQSHLLAAFVPAAYRQPLTGSGTGRRRRRHWDPERAEHWLGYLARHLVQRDKHDLAWWELGTTMSLPSRTLLIGFLGALAFGVTTAIGNLPVDLVATSHGLGFALVRGLVVGLLHGLAAGTVCGLAHWFASRREDLKPSPVRLRIRGGTGKARGRVLRGFVIGLGAGLTAALGLVLIDRVVVAALGLDDGLGGGVSGVLTFVPGVGLGAGLVLGLIALLEAPIAPESAVRPTDVLDTNRRNVVGRLLVWALVFGPVPGFIDGLTHGPVRGIEFGLVFGLEGAFAGGLGYGLVLTAWGQWAALCRIWLPLTGRLPWALVAFLDDAHERGVLRQAGAMYQFRHARVEGHLSRAFQERNEPRRPGSPDTAGAAPGPRPGDRLAPGDTHQSSATANHD
ncbi:NACHT domain-containing protein [Kitasatospora sp. NPDC052896]|uniref:NACHT domain-containing protein n=1 Tax=Kitasatospora sp. NPDC052896 TaxID=3364061 RepID=UPI0037CB54FA